MCPNPRACETDFANMMKSRILVWVLLQSISILVDPNLGCKLELPAEWLQLLMYGHTQQLNQSF